MRHAWLAALSLCVVAQNGGWTAWSAREELKPETSQEGEWLVVRGGGKAESYGGWVRRIDSIRGGAWYRLTAEYVARGVAAENWQVVARIDWLDAAGRRRGSGSTAGACRRGMWRPSCGQFRR